MRTDRPNCQALACCAALLAALATSCGGGGGDAGSPAAAGTGAASGAASTADGSGGTGSGSASSTGSGSAGGASAADGSPDASGFAVVPSGIAACPAPAAAVQFDAARGFTFDAAFQRSALAERLAHLRCLGGVAPVVREARLDLAADRHAAYLIDDGSTSHEERAGAALFSGATPGDRLRAAGYVGATWGEVLARTGPLADDAYEGLVAAIYHRLLMLSPQFDEVGVGMRATGQGSTVSVANYAARTRLATGRVVVYPADGQRSVPVSFDTDREVPDPAPGAGVVGYPVSLQVDRSSRLAVERFELVRVADGSVVAASVRSAAATAVSDGSSGSGATPDPLLGANETFLMPLAPLDAGAEYEARFAGRLDGAPLTRAWRFRTLPQQPLAVAPDTVLARGEHVRVRLAGCDTRYDWTYTPGLEAKLYTAGWLQVRGVQAGPGTIELRDGCGRTQRLDFTVR